MVSILVKSRNRNFSGKCEVFGQQAEAGKAARGPWQQRFLRGEAGRFDAAAGHHHRRRIDRGVGVGDGDRVAAQQLVQRQRLVGGAAQEEAQAIDAELAEGRIGRQAFQRDAQHPGGTAGGGIGRCDDRQAGQADALHVDRPERHRAGGTVAQRLAMHRLGVEHHAGGQPGGDHQVRLAVELRDHARGDGRQVVRVEQPEQRVGEFGEFVVETVVDAPGEEGHAFQQARDVRVVHRVGGQAQAAGDLRLGLGEFRGQPFDGVEFAIVIWKEGIGHFASFLTSPALRAGEVEVLQHRG